MTSSSFVRGSRVVAAFALVLACVALPAIAQQPDAIARETALHALLQKVDMPLARQVFARMMTSIRANAPSAFVEGYGRNAQLGDAWKAGHPDWERARTLVADRLAQEEAARGPVFAVTRLDIERALDVPWTEDDIRFLDESARTPLGQALLRLLDAGIATGFVESVARDGAIADDARGAYREALDKARTQYTEALADADRLAKDDLPRAERLRRLIATENTSAMQALGAALFRPSTRRFAQLMSDLVPQLDGIATTFRARR